MSKDTEQEPKTQKIDDEFLKSQGVMMFKSAQTGHDLIMQRMFKDMELYDGKFSANERKYSDFLGAERLFINKTYTNTQRIVLEALTTVIPSPNEIIDVESDKSMPYENQQAIKVLLNHRLDSHPINFYQEAYELCLDAVRNMYGVLKVYPDLITDTRTVKKVTTETGDDGLPYESTKEHDEEYIKAYEPRMDCIPPEDVFFAASATWKDYYKFAICHRYKRTRDELKRRKYKNYMFISKANPQGSSDILKNQRKEDFATPFQSETQVKMAEEVWVYEFWDNLPGDEDLLEAGSFIMVGSESGPELVARDWEENELPTRFSEFELNRPPFVLGMAYPEPHRFEGKSFPWITESSQKEINAIANQEREAVARKLRPTTYINQDAEIDLMALVNRKIGGYVKGTGPADQAIREIETMDPMGISAAARNRVDADYFEAGIPPNLNGLDSDQGTATGETQQLTNANKKVEFVIKNIVHTAFLPAFKLLLRYEQAYSTDEYINAVTGKKLGKHLGTEEVPAWYAIQGDFDLKVNIGVNRQSKTNITMLMLDRCNQTIQTLGQLLNLHAIDAQHVQFPNPMVFFKHLLEINGMKNTDEFMLPALPVPMDQGQSGGAPSLPGNIQDPGQAVSQMSPQGTGTMNVA